MRTNGADLQVVVTVTNYVVSPWPRSLARIVLQALSEVLCPCSRPCRFSPWSWH
jgi:hypothetical protein